MISSFEAKLRANEGDYKSAYALMQQMPKEREKINITMMDEIDNLPYAHTESERNKEELKKAEAAKKQRTFDHCYYPGGIGGRHPDLCQDERRQEKDTQTY